MIYLPLIGLFSMRSRHHFYFGSCHSLPLITQVSHSKEASVCLSPDKYLSKPTVVFWNRISKSGSNLSLGVMYFSEATASYQ